MTARLFTLNPLEGFRPKTFAGHKDLVLNAFFSTDGKTVSLRTSVLKTISHILYQIYTVSRDGAVFTWREKHDAQSDDDSDAPMQVDTTADLGRAIAQTRWGIAERHYFNHANTKVVCCTFHAPSNLLIVGFSSGVFGLWEMPGFSNLHTLSVSQERITSVAVNRTGEWLAFGASKLGQLLVWEWQSESYVLKQQGHFFDMNALSYSSDAQHIATGGDDGKVKVWNTTSGFCFVTFTEHTAAVSCVDFAKQGQVLFTASLDGTVRAYDLVRYRNFRTFTSPSPVQFTSLAVDPSGEVVAAGSTDTFEIFIWSVQTGKLLDILAGHEGPVSALAFSPTGNQLASASWDKTVRIWNPFNRTRVVEPFQLTADALSVAFRPDGKELAASTLDGQLWFWDVVEGRQTNIIEGRKDISGGRKADDRVAASNNSSTKSFSSIAYTADGACLIGGGNSKYVVLYDVRAGVMVRKFQISDNLSLDGTQEMLDSRRMTDGGPLDLVDERGDESDLEDRLDRTLPGVGRGDLSKRRYRREARTSCVRFSPTGRAWAAASTEGLLIYSLDESVAFDPFDLDVELTPQSVLATLAKREHVKALVMAFRLGERPLIRRAYEAVPPSEVTLVARQMPRVYLPQLLRLVGEHLERGPHAEFALIWATSALVAHGRFLRERAGEYASVFRVLQKGLMDFNASVAKM